MSYNNPDLYDSFDNPEYDHNEQWSYNPVAGDILDDDGVVHTGANRPRALYGRWLKNGEVKDYPVVSGVLPVLDAVVEYYRGSRITPPSSFGRYSPWVVGDIIHFEWRGTDYISRIFEFTAYFQIQYSESGFGVNCKLTYKHTATGFHLTCLHGLDLLKFEGTFDHHSFRNGTCYS